MDALSFGIISSFLARCCVSLPFQYMSHAVGIPSCYKRVGASWDQLLHNVAFPLMAFNDEDARLWTEDPQEYIRKARGCVVECSPGRGRNIIEGNISEGGAVATLREEG